VIEIPPAGEAAIPLLLYDDREVLVVAEDGYAKRTGAGEFRKTRPGAKGVRVFGPGRAPLVGIFDVDKGAELLVGISTGNIVRVAVAEASRQGRNARGVKLVELRRGERVTAVTVVPA
jgi:DNA gyrase subunit A